MRVDVDAGVGVGVGVDVDLEVGVAVGVAVKIATGPTDELSAGGAADPMVAAIARNTASRTMFRAGRDRCRLLATFRAL